MYKEIITVSGAKSDVFPDNHLMEGNIMRTQAALVQFINPLIEVAFLPLEEADRFQGSFRFIFLNDKAVCQEFLPFLAKLKEQNPELGEQLTKIIHL